MGTETLQLVVHPIAQAFVHHLFLLASILQLELECVQETVQAK
jgi:hypothetical protein